VGTSYIDLSSQIMIAKKSLTKRMQQFLSNYVNYQRRVLKQNIIVTVAIIT